MADPPAADRGELEDEQDDRRGSRRSATSSCPRSRTGASRSAEVVICPPFLALPLVAQLCAGTGVGVAGQNMYFEESGAFTGEVSRGDAARRRRDRRSCSATPNAASSSARPTRRWRARSRWPSMPGLLPILCVGESDDERERDDTDQVLRRQVDAALSRVPTSGWPTSSSPTSRSGRSGPARRPPPSRRTTPAASSGRCRRLRSAEAGERIRIQYGGSVKPANAAGAARPDRDRRRARRRRRPRPRGLRCDRRGGVASVIGASRDA